MQKFETICVYCGSSKGVNPEFINAAAQVGAYLARENLTLIYGGGQTGLMGATAKAALDAGGKAVGIIPEKLVHAEIEYGRLTESIIVPDMHTRKALMAQRADAFIALPGGIGTFEELFEIWTWLQIGYHTKPVGLLNVAGFYDGLLSFLDSVTAQGFMHPTQREFLIVDTNIENLIKRMQTFQAPDAAAWLKSRPLEKV